MKRLSLQVDDLAYIRTALQDDSYDPVRFGIVAEIAGAHGLVCTYTSSSKGIQERDLRLLKELSKSFFNLHIPVNDDALKLALSVMPDMVTFVDVKSNDPRNFSSIDLSLHQPEIEQMVPDLQANKISVSILIKPELDALKVISKLPIDYIEIDVSDFTTASDINEEIVVLDKIKSAAMAVGKWGMGVNCFGNIGYDDIPALAQAPNLEDITIGSELIQRSLLVGIDKAIEEALQLIRHREID
jgi:pyridoxine 5-phosphate synthase